MMNWNSNDTKYIIKRIILYFIIAGIVFFAGQSCAKAMTVSSDYFNTSTNPQCTLADGDLQCRVYPNRTIFSNLGVGYINFNVLMGTAPNSSGSMSYVVNYAVVSGNNIFQCEVGHQQMYRDNNNMVQLSTVKCPVFLDSNGISSIYFSRQSSAGTVGFTLSNIVTFTADSEVSSAIMNNTNSIIQQQISNDNTNTQSIINSVNNATQQEITAINNQTTAINNQTEWFEEQHDPLIDTGFLDVMGDLITTNDSNVVRQFIMIPFNLFVQLYNACTSNTCSPLTLGTLYGTTLTLPCINWTTLVGSAIANTIDIIFSACLIFGMYRMIKHMINKIFTLSSTITDECGVEVFN